MKKNNIDKCLEQIQYTSLNNYKKPNGDMAIEGVFYPRGIVGSLESIGITVIAEKWRSNYDNASEIRDVFRAFLSGNKILVDKVLKASNLKPSRDSEIRRD